MGCGQLMMLSLELVRLVVDNKHPPSGAVHNCCMFVAFNCNLFAMRVRIEKQRTEANIIFSGGSSSTKSERERDKGEAALIDCPAKGKCPQMYIYIYLFIYILYMLPTRSRHLATCQLA